VPNARVKARTLSGFEEGLFAWMTLNKKGHGEDFGIVEMGGASAQVAFPCPDCADAKTILIDNNKRIKMFSYSFLGLGGNEAGKNEVISTSPTTITVTVDQKSQKKEERSIPKSCVIGNSPEGCKGALKLTNGKEEIFDPYNYGSAETGKGIYKALPQQQIKKVATWFGTGAFAYSYKPETKTSSYCKGEAPAAAHEPETACFREVYFPTFLNAVGVDANQYKSSTTSWTLGAASCERENCLAEAELECNWMENQECLKN